MAEQEKQPTRAVAARRPFRDIADLEERLDRMFSPMWWPRRWRPLRAKEPELWLPAVDIFEKNGIVHVKAEVPGLTEKDVEITVTEDSLIISGERSEEKEVKEEDYYRCERSYGKFVREVALPTGTDTELAKASFKDGVLNIELPLKEAPKRKKIPVTPAG